MKRPVSQANAVCIRRASPADVEALFEIRTSVVENHMTRRELAAMGVTPSAIAALLANDRFVAFVATDGGRAAGFSIARADIADIFALFVKPEAQGVGHGSQLLAHAERWLAANNVRLAWLLTSDELGTRAVSFYERRGWRKQNREADGQLRFTKRLEQLSDPEK